MEDEVPDIEGLIAYREDEISEIQNFLKVAPYQAFNVAPSSWQNGQAVFELQADLTSYHHLEAIIIDEDSVT